MNIHQLPKIVTRSKKRRGRGHGSGKVKTGGRGTKGQKARESLPLGFEGGQLPLIKRLPLLRGKGRNKSRQVKAHPINVEKLNRLPAGTRVTLDTLHRYTIISKDVAKVKILGSGRLQTKLTVALPSSKSAKTVIEKAGGMVEHS